MSLSEDKFMYLLDIAFEQPTRLDMLTNKDDWSQMSELQQLSIQSAAAVSHVGGRGTAIDGLTRIWENFPGNFTKGGRLTGIGGKVKQGSMTEEQYYHKDMVMHTVQSEIDAGMSQKKACEKYGASAKSYRDWRDRRAKNQAKRRGKVLGK